MDSNQSGIDGGTIWGQMIIQGEQQYARLEMNQSASFSLIEILQFKKADEMINDVSLFSHIGLKIMHLNFRDNWK